jgi:hypothetical protein
MGDFFLLYLMGDFFLLYLMGDFFLLYLMGDFFLHSLNAARKRVGITILPAKSGVDSAAPCPQKGAF